MTKNIVIRQANSEDLAGPYRIKPGVSGADYFEKCLEEQKEGKRLVLMVTLDDEDSGYAILNWKPQYPLFRRLDIPEIQDLNVIPAARRQGVASALIKHCETLAKEKFHEQMGISVGLYSDYGAAQRLYVRSGYVPDGNGVAYDRQNVSPGEIRPIDDDLCLMMIKEL